MKDYYTIREYLETRLRIVEKFGGYTFRVVKLTPLMAQTLEYITEYQN